MFTYRKVTSDTYYVGTSDYKKESFENHIPIPHGMAYNSYIIVDEKTALFDATDSSTNDRFLKNVEKVLKDNKRGLDYIVITHMEPDHSSALDRLLEKYPEAMVVCNKKTQTLFNQFFETSLEGREYIVNEGDKLILGRHEIEFFMTPMVHWPEVMMCFDHYTGALFSADAFGAFGALYGNLFDSEVKFDEIVIAEYRRYYSNIVGKYGPQVMRALAKAEKYNIQMILPLHGYILHQEITKIVELYKLWATYTPEEKGALIVFASMYDHTKEVAQDLAHRLKEKNVNKVRVYDVSKQDPTYLVSEAFKYSDIIFASVTHNNSIYIKMEEYLLSLIASNIQNRNFYLIENGSWVPVAANLMREKLAILKNCKTSNNVLTINSAYKESNVEMMLTLTDEIANNIKG